MHIHKVADLQSTDSEFGMLHSCFPWISISARFINESKGTQAVWSGSFVLSSLSHQTQVQWKEKEKARRRLSLTACIVRQPSCCCPLNGGLFSGRPSAGGPPPLCLLSAVCKNSFKYFLQRKTAEVHTQHLALNLRRGEDVTVSMFT